ncbi:DUF1425 domain-containing protein [Mucisphaera calidilacus]|uniref:Lipoprotein n=1 Tax=Mucisphaera calidilacus TaxID=2527982 RepID=A0A518BTE0_9BACT|nr:hypothetical protein [Mucisphaera calidilacus]QDU70238.1 hypothetical protein Pan265_00600 [Mucisphaera calidilacus]
MSRYGRSGLGMMALAAGLGLSMLAGCQTDPGIKAGWVAGEETSQVIASEKDLRGKLRTGKYIVKPSTADKPMEVTVPVRLVEGKKAIAIQYRYQFFLSDGTPVKHDSAWRTAELEPDVQEFLRGSATDYFASDWNLEIRSDRSQ